MEPLGVGRIPVHHGAEEVDTRKEYDKNRKEHEFSFSLLLRWKRGPFFARMLISIIFEKGESRA